jgi:hypothetical protein
MLANGKKRQRSCLLQLESTIQTNRIEHGGDAQLKCEQTFEDYGKRFRIHFQQDAIVAR